MERDQHALLQVDEVGHDVLPVELPGRVGQQAGQLVGSRDVPDLDELLDGALDPIGEGPVRHGTQQPGRSNQRRCSKLLETPSGGSSEAGSVASMISSPCLR